MLMYSAYGNMKIIINKLATCHRYAKKVYHSQ